MTTYKQCLLSGIVRILANLLMVGAIFLAMYQAARWAVWPSELVFCAFFFGITIPVWLLAWGTLKWIRRKGSGAAGEPSQARLDLNGF